MVAVRNTDINAFIKYLKHTHYIGREIALHAKKIFFISKAEMDEFIESDFVRPIFSQIKDKMVLQLLNFSLRLKNLWSCRLVDFSYLCIQNNS